jgi:hypothetical protein
MSDDSRRSAIGDRENDPANAEHEAHDAPAVSRRDMVAFLAAAPLSVFAISAEDVARVALRTRDAIEAEGQQFTPKYFTPDEYRTVRVLVDMIIPRDKRSGSATDAGVPQFMDFILVDRPRMQEWMRPGLKWLDDESKRRTQKAFAASTAVERGAILDDIAWPKKARSEMEQGVAFFNHFRDFTASGFWSSRIGVRDLGYMGNTAVAAWNGCPPAALKKVGVSYRKA